VTRYYDEPGMHCTNCKRDMQPEAADVDFCSFECFEAYETELSGRVEPLRNGNQVTTPRILATALAIILAVGALLLALTTSGCAGRVEENEPGYIVGQACSPGPFCPPETPHCAALPEGNECRPNCVTDDDCNFGARCVTLAGPGSEMVCERWLSKGYWYPYAD